MRYLTNYMRKGGTGMVYVSDHGGRRIRSRCGIKKRAVRKLANEAFTRGLTGSLNRYITALYFYNQSANNIRIYKDKVYLFAGTRLITVLNLPQRYRKSVVSCLQRRESDRCVERR